VQGIREEAALVTHFIVDECEQSLNDQRYWVVRCECGQTFSSTSAAGLTPRRSARAAFRHHLDEVLV
jgi:hypothetical protein